MPITKRPGGPSPTQQKVHDQISRPTAAESKRLHVPVPPEMYRRMKRQAADEDRSIAEITREIWQRYLDGASDE